MFLHKKYMVRKRLPGQTEGRTERRTNNLISIYLPNFVCGGIKTRLYHPCGVKMFVDLKKCLVFRKKEKFSWFSLIRCINHNLKKKTSKVLRGRKRFVWQTFHRKGFSLKSGFFSFIIWNISCQHIVLHVIKSIG